MSLSEPLIIPAGYRIVRHGFLSWGWLCESDNYTSQFRTCTATGAINYAQRHAADYADLEMARASLPTEPAE